MLVFSGNVIFTIQIGIFNLIFGIIVQVSKTDTLPLKICLPCERMVLRTHQFYMQCKEANAKLRRLTVQNKTKNSYVSWNLKS